MMKKWKSCKQCVKKFFKIMIPNADNLILSYDCNLGKRNSFYLNPMDYFHPDGYKYNTQMFGPNKVILVKDVLLLLGIVSYILT